MWKSYYCGLLLALVAAAAPLAYGNSDQQVIYNTRYPSTAGQTTSGNNCLLCHSSVPSLNSFGQAFKNAGPDSTNGLAQIEFLDSDGDNFVNVHEILVFNLPGNNLSVPANANAAPVLNAIGNKTINEGQTLNFQVSTTDEVNLLNPLLSVSGLPPGASFTDNRNRTATFNWVTDFSDNGVYNNITFTSSDGKLSDTETITITVNNINNAPAVDFQENQVAHPGTLLEFDVTATDPESGALALSVTGAPAGSSFVDNGDGSGTFSWAPSESDLGIYPGVTFTAEDDSNQTDGVSIAIFITPQPKLYLSGEQALNSTHADDSVVDFGVDLATDGQGHWVAVWYIGDTGLVMAQRSADNGVTWDTPAPVSPLNGSDEAPSIATDGDGNWIVIWRSTNNLGNTIGDDLDILYARSTDNGQTWTTAAPLNPDAFIDSESHRGANIETDGDVWIASWMKGTQVFAIRSANAGLSWAEADLLGIGIVQFFPDSTAPTIAADGGGNWVIAWSDGTAFASPPNDLDIQMARSTDGGLNWTEQADLNANAGSDVGDDEMPSITTDGSGTWMTVWRSQNSLGNTIGADADILLARSLDNGQTWTTPVPLAMDAPYDGFVWDYAPSIATNRRGAWVAMWHRKIPVSGCPIPTMRA